MYCTGSKGTCDRDPDRQWLNRMKQRVHHARLTHRRRRHLYGKAKIVEIVSLDLRTVGIGNLVGFGVEQIEHVKLDAPAILISVAESAIEDAGRGRAECIVFC